MTKKKTATNPSGKRPQSVSGMMLDPLAHPTSFSLHSPNAAPIDYPVQAMRERMQSGSLQGSRLGILLAILGFFLLAPYSPSFNTIIVIAIVQYVWLTTPPLSADEQPSKKARLKSRLTQTFWKSLPWGIGFAIAAYMRSWVPGVAPMRWAIGIEIGLYVLGVGICLVPVGSFIRQAIRTRKDPSA